MTKTLLRLCAVAAMAVAALPLPVPLHAANVTLTGWQFGSGGNVSGNMYAGVAGGFHGTLAGAGVYDAASFDTYCIELAEHFSFGAAPMANYSVINGTNYFGALRADHMARLMTYVADHPGVVDTAAESTSLQLAVWNIVYDNDYSVTVNSSFNDSSLYASYANTLLAGAAATSVVRYEVFALQKAGTQDFLLSALLPRPNEGGSSRVDEPAGAVLTGAALCAMFWLKRRRVRF